MWWWWWDHHHHQPPPPPTTTTITIITTTKSAIACGRENIQILDGPPPSRCTILSQTQKDFSGGSGHIHKVLSRRSNKPCRQPTSETLGCGNSASASLDRWNWLNNFCVPHSASLFQYRPHLQSMDAPHSADSVVGFAKNGEVVLPVARRITFAYGPVRKIGVPFRDSVRSRGPPWLYSQKASRWRWPDSPFPDSVALQMSPTIELDALDVVSLS